jgi:hypothetical protein
MTMKIFCKLLALGVFHHWGATAFFVPVPKTSRVLHAYEYFEPGYDEYTYWNGENSVDTFVAPHDPTYAPLTRYNPPQERTSEWWDTSDVQGGSLQTWSSDYERMNVQLQSQGRPLYADVELWEGPNNTPQSMRLYSEDGYSRPIQAGFDTRGYNTMSIRNTGPMEYPMDAGVRGGYTQTSRRSSDYRMSESVQGGALRTFLFGHSVNSVQVELHTDGLPLMATVELWQGPSNIKQIAEVYSDDGRRSFSAVIDTPGYESTIAIRNTGPVEFPLRASLYAS